MHFETDFTYHVYNRSNEKLFYSRDNYLFFLHKMRQEIELVCKILAYCLMPNHFHFLIVATKKSVENASEKHRQDTQVLSKKFGVVLSSYTQAINKQENRKGSLFAHKTTAKQLNFSENNYLETAFFYIHQNPLEANLVNNLKKWEYSSYLDYIGMRNGSLIDKQLAKEMINIDFEDYGNLGNRNLSDDDIKNIF